MKSDSLSEAIYEALSEIDKYKKDLMANLTARNSHELRVGFFNTDIPVEIASAAGVHPVKVTTSLIPKNTGLFAIDSIVQPFNCSWSRLILKTIMDGLLGIDHYIFSENYCDSLQNLYDVCRLSSGLKDESNLNSFRFLHPMKRDKSMAVKFYFKESIRLKKWLEDSLEKKITAQDLLESINLHNERRRLLRVLEELVSSNISLTFSEFFRIKLGTDFLPVDQAVNLLQSVVHALKGYKTAASNSVSSKRVMISGGMFDNPVLFDEIPDLNESIKTDDLSSCSRSFNFGIDTRIPVDNHHSSIDTLIMQIARSYILDKIPDAVHLDFNRRKEYLIDQLRKFQVQAVIFIVYSFCDPDTFEIRSLTSYLNKKGINSIVINTDPELSNIGQITTRIEAFLETNGGIM